MDLTDAFPDVDLELGAEVAVGLWRAVSGAAFNAEGERRRLAMGSSSAVDASGWFHGRFQLPQCALLDVRLFCLASFRVVAGGGEDVIESREHALTARATATRAFHRAREADGLTPHARVLRILKLAEQEAWTTTECRLRHRLSLSPCCNLLAWQRWPRLGRANYE